MLDADCTFLWTAAPDDHIWWGAYLGTPDEIVLAGTVGTSVRPSVDPARGPRAHGWIMDIYLLPRPEWSEDLVEGGENTIGDLGPQMTKSRTYGREWL